MTLDDGTVYAECKFTEKGKITAGELETQTPAGGVTEHVYLNVGFGVKIYA